MASDESEVLAANRSFYEAFTRRDLPAIDAMWSEHAPVACIHPGWDALHGREDVLASWRAILANPDAPAIKCLSPQANVLGDSAFVVCGESFSGNDLIATNVFVREHGAWKLVHHQSGPVSTRRPELKPVPKPNKSKMN